MRLLAVLLFVFGLEGVAHAQAVEPRLEGYAVIIDGDTIEMTGVRVRLFGIDAPEKRQSCQTFSGRPYKCGRRSGAWLGKLIGGRLVRCADFGQAKFGRRWGRCFAGKLNLQAAMVRAGQARAYQYHSNEYVGEQREAKKYRRGIWQGLHIRPGQFRKCWRKGGSPRHCSR